MEKVVFLDVDGVIKPMLSKFKPVKEGLSSSCLICLKRLIRATGAVIVLSSTWRNHPKPCELLTGALERFGLSFVSVTPTASSIYATRGTEITEWLLEHPKTERYVILDDYPKEQFEGHENHFVEINFKTGLTMEHVEKAIEILN